MVSCRWPFLYKTHTPFELDLNFCFSDQFNIYFITEEYPDVCLYNKMYDNEFNEDEYKHIFI